MGLISDLLFFPVTGPAHGLLFIVEQLKAQVDDALLGETSRIEDDLLNLGLRYEQGALSDEDYVAQEAHLLEELNRVRQEQEEWFQGAETEDEADEVFLEEDSLSSQRDNPASDAAAENVGTPTTQESSSADELHHAADDNSRAK